MIGDGHTGISALRKMGVTRPLSEPGLAVRTNSRSTPTCRTVMRARNHLERAATAGCTSADHAEAGERYVARRQPANAR